MNENNNNTSVENTNSDFKYKRILLLYTRLLAGETINKTKTAAEFHVSERSIQRDLDDLRTFFDEQAADGKISYQLVYDRKKQGYFLKSEETMFFTNSKIITIYKVLLQSRAFRRDELELIMEKIVNNCIPKEKQSVINQLISDDSF